MCAVGLGDVPRGESEAHVQTGAVGAATGKKVQRPFCQTAGAAPFRHAEKPSCAQREVAGEPNRNSKAVLVRVGRGSGIACGPVPFTGGRGMGTGGTTGFQFKGAVGIEIITDVENVHE